MVVDQKHSYILCLKYFYEIFLNIVFKSIFIRHGDGAELADYN